MANQKHVREPPAARHLRNVMQGGFGCQARSHGPPRGVEQWHQYSVQSRRRLIGDVVALWPHKAHHSNAMIVISRRNKSFEGTRQIRRK